MGLFKKTQPTYAEMANWTVRQYVLRAESLEAHQLVAELQKIGVPAAEIMWKFVETQWPIVIQEAGAHFRTSAVSPLFKDLDALASAVK